MISLEPGPNESSADPAAHRLLADTRREQGDELAALAHLIAAQTLEAHRAGAPARSLDDLCKVATGYFMKGDHAAAERWYRLLLTLAPGQAIAHQNLAAIHAGRGEGALADACRQRAYRAQRVFVEEVDEPARRLLILCAGRTSGNVPFETLLSSRRSSRVKYVIDFAAEAEDTQLPPFDLVFNAIGEPDVAQPLQGRLERFASLCGRPLLNAPAAVARTRRDRLPALLDHLEGVVVAPCSRHECAPASRADLADRLARAALRWPVLARPEATHGGNGLVRCDTIAALETALRAIPGAHYLTAYHDGRGGDGHHRKYRVVFVDGQPFVVHLAISSHWMVHYFSAGMESHAWKLAEEQRFLEDPGAALGEPAMAALTAMGRRLGLDYAGVDFTVLPDGRLFVFEANATMLVHPERSNGPLAYRNRHVQRIVDAFEQLQANRTAVKRAPPALP